MVARNSFIKTAFVFSSTLTISMATVLPSFAQAQSVETNIAEVTTEKSIQVPVETEVASGLTDQILPLSAEIEAPVLEASDPAMPALEASDAEAPELETLTAETSVTETPENASEVSDENTDGATQLTDSAGNSEVAMAELVEALNADMNEIQAMAKPAEEIAAQVPEPAAAPPQPGAAAFGELASVGLANSQLLQKGTALNPAALSALSANTLSANTLSANAPDPLPGIEADSVPALTAALNSDNTLTQLYAADALWTLTRDSELVLPALISAATTGNFQTRELATLGLSYLGRQALPAIPFLNRLLGDNDSRVRSIVQDTLDIVGSNNRPATTLGILARETSRRPGIIPAALSVLNLLWR